MGEGVLPHLDKFQNIVLHVHCSWSSPVTYSFVATFVECRVIGGLLSAYDLSDDKVFLEKARDIADRLLPAWNTPSGIPYNIINLRYGDAHNPRWTGVSSKLLSLLIDILRLFFPDHLWHCLPLFVFTF